MENRLLERLTLYRQKNKTEPTLWVTKEFEKPDVATCLKIENIINTFVDIVIGLVNNQATERVIKYELKKQLAELRCLDLNYNERIFAGEKFDQICLIMNINMTYQIEKWLNGFFVSVLFVILNAYYFRPKKNSLIFYCSSCDNTLAVQIKKGTTESTNESYFIVKCLLCDEFNLIDIGSKIPAGKLRAIIPVEHLPKKDYTYNEAFVRLEQVKFFRK